MTIIKLQKGSGVKVRLNLATASVVLFAVIAVVQLAGLGLTSNNSSRSLLTLYENDCISQIQEFLTADEIASALHLFLCSSPDQGLAELVMRDRSKLRVLERREYLRELRSYRISGLICNDNMDPSIPPVGSEPAFKCLPREYKRRACMDGRASYPEACSAYGAYNHTRSIAPYVPEKERGTATTASQFHHPQECAASTAAGVSICHETLAGKAPYEAGQFAAGVPEAKVLTLKGGRPIWRKEALDFHLSIIAKGKDVSPLDYPGAHPALQKAMEVVHVQGKTAAIFGSISPWVESILHHNGIQSPTTTVDYNQPTSYDERLKTGLMNVMLEERTQYDVVVSYSSIEHDGQGRYGDPLDPDGDLSAMKEVWLKVAPGGYFLLNVPWSGTGGDNFYWVSMRTYGQSRLPLLIRGWEYVGLSTSKKVYGPDEAFSIAQVSQHSPVFILRKPLSVDAKDVLDTAKFGGLSCQKKMCGKRLQNTL